MRLNTFTNTKFNEMNRQRMSKFYAIPHLIICEMNDKVGFFQYMQLLKRGLSLFLSLVSIVN